MCFWPVYMYHSSVQIDFEYHALCFDEWKHFMLFETQNFVLLFFLFDFERCFYIHGLPVVIEVDFVVSVNVSVFVKFFNHGEISPC